MRAESKVNLGAIQIHRRVIADICSAAASQVEGAYLAPNRKIDGFLNFFGARSNSAVDVRVDARNQVTVVIKVNVKYGENLTEISRRIQDVVMSAVEKMADINLKDIDVSIQGIERG